ncbi:hypothetical protein A33Q_2190 [Indibacter alkaliphilus LW1]|uniref:Uncharacterized protein n=1 Tax=Indibacter alkaliphilus (strain CCUG 57479 / KCTC 22604 / LW1) TaxID=1189612 RepID=S2DI59_INDAL|nr:hypothetical protein A33Q_2190 [Indibacter alkaliphilus LW1]
MVLNGGGDLSNPKKEKPWNDPGKPKSDLLSIHQGGGVGENQF